MISCMISNFKMMFVTYDIIFLLSCREASKPQCKRLDQGNTNRNQLVLGPTTRVSSISHSIEPGLQSLHPGTISYCADRGVPQLQIIGKTMSTMLKDHYLTNHPNPGQAGSPAKKGLHVKKHLEVFGGRFPLGDLGIPWC